MPSWSVFAALLLLVAQQLVVAAPDTGVTCNAPEAVLAYNDMSKPHVSCVNVSTGQATSLFPTTASGMAAAEGGQIFLIDYPSCCIATLSPLNPCAQSLQMPPNTARQNFAYQTVFDGPNTYVLVTGYSPLPQIRLGSYNADPNAAFVELASWDTHDGNLTPTGMVLDPATGLLHITAVYAYGPYDIGAYWTYDLSTNTAGSITNTSWVAEALALDASAGTLVAAAWPPPPPPNHSSSSSSAPPRGKAAPTSTAAAEVEAVADTVKHSGAKSSAKNSAKRGAKRGGMGGVQIVYSISLSTNVVSVLPPITVPPSVISLPGAPILFIPSSGQRLLYLTVYQGSSSSSYASSGSGSSGGGSSGGGSSSAGTGDVVLTARRRGDATGTGTGSSGTSSGPGDTLLVFDIDTGAQVAELSMHQFDASVVYVPMAQ